MDESTSSPEVLVALQSGHNCYDQNAGIIKSTFCSLDLIEETPNEITEDEKADETIYVPFDVNYYNLRDDMSDYTYNIYAFTYYPSYLSEFF